MASRVMKLANKGLIVPPPWLCDNMMFEAMTGSIAYGCNDPGDSDVDIVGICVPPKYYIFPHILGHIPGFGTHPPVFQQFQHHHVEVKDWGKEFDITVYGIVRFFELCRDNNPNMIDILFSPHRCITQSTALWRHLRDHRKLFLHRGAWHRFRGYAYSQLSKLKSDVTRKNPKRQKAVAQYGYDTKFAYNIVRLALECEQILETGDLILDRDREVYKSIRNGEWTLERVQNWFDTKEAGLEELYRSTKLPEYPDEDALKKLLLECLEQHYGTLREVFVSDSRGQKLLADLGELYNKYADMGVSHE